MHKVPVFKITCQSNKMGGFMDHYDSAVESRKMEFNFYEKVTGYFTLHYSESQMAMYQYLIICNVAQLQWTHKDGNDLET